MDKGKDAPRVKPTPEQCEELAEAEGRVRAVLENVVDGIITIDEEAIVQTFNPAAERIFGYAAAEVIGQNVKMLMPEPYHDRHDEYVGHYVHTGEARIIGMGREVTGRRKDGSTFPMDLAVSEFRLRGRQMFVGITRDISVRKRAEETFKFLAEASAALSVLVDYESALRRVAHMAVPRFAEWCAVDMAQADGSLHRVAIVHADAAKLEAARRIDDRFGLAFREGAGPAEVVRTGRSELIADVDDSVLRRLARDEDHLRAMRTLGTKSYMCTVMESRGKRMGAIVFAVSDSGRKYTPTDLAVAEDLAHRAAISIENARLYAEVRENARRKDEFLAMLAHELRNPLAPIRTGLDLMDMPECDAATAAWARGMMKQQLQQLIRLVEDLLDVSRIMRGKIQLRKERTSLAEIVARGVETARPAIDAAKHELVVSMPKDPVWVDVDPVRIAQVVANLLNNAAKYNDKPGHILVSAQREGEEAVVRVMDDGVGIDKDLLPQVFDLFTQADRSLARSQGGLGIGLTLVRSLVERHGGSVEAFSEGPGRGSEFVVRLPALAGPPNSAEEAKANGQAAAASAATPRRVLVCDDNADAARTFAEIAALWKHDVRVTYTGAAALELAKSYHPDVVLLDIGLPGMSGYQVARLLRRQPEFAHTMLVAVTGYGQDEDRRRSREAGFNHHLVKPVAPDALHDVLAAPIG